MTKQKSTFTEGCIRYWHPRKGGWYHARLVKLGRKWAALTDYWPTAHPKRFRVPVSNVQKAVL